MCYLKESDLKHKDTKRYWSVERGKNIPDHIWLNKFGVAILKSNFTLRQKAMESIPYHRFTFQDVLKKPINLHSLDNMALSLLEI